MPFSEDTRIEALVKAARHCCICHRFRGTKIECHHIVEEAAGGADTLDNCIPICFDCHADMKSYDFQHPRGTRYRPKELEKHREAWYARVAQVGVGRAAPDSQAADTEVFHRLRFALPWDPTVRWLTEHDFGGEFSGDRLDEINRYVEHGENPNEQFIDAELEAQRAALAAHVREFRAQLGVRVFRADGGGRWYSVSREWSDGQREAARQLLNDLAQAVVESYNDFVSSTRRKLGVA